MHQRFWRVELGGCGRYDGDEGSPYVRFTKDSESKWEISVCVPRSQVCTSARVSRPQPRGVMMRAKRVKRPAGCQSLTLALFMIAGLVTPALGQQRSPGYSEVGMSVTKFEDAMFVYNVFVQGPADEAKIQAGEFITHVDGVETKDMSVEEFVQKVGGETGSEVEFTVKQTEYLLPAPRTVKITREPVTPFTFQARTTSGESFDAAVQGLYFFSGNKSAPDREDRKYSAVFDAFIPFEYIYSEIPLILRAL